VEAADILGKTVLIGVTYLDARGAMQEQRQYHGVVVEVDLIDGIEVRQASGELLNLPPAPELFEVADPGQYTLRSTGEVVSDPDLLCAWTVSEPDDGGESADNDDLEALLDRATSYNDENRFEEGEADARRATEAAPDNALGWVELGRALWGLDREEEALLALEHALKLEESMDALNYLGWVHIELGRHGEALEAARRSLELEPDTYTALHTAGEALIGLGRPEEAIQPLTAAAELVPDSWLAWSDLTRAYGDAGLLAEAVEASRRAVEAEPDKASLWHDLGAALLEQGRHEEAVEPLERSLELDAADSDAWVTLGRAEYCNGNLHNAQVAYEHAIEIDPYEPAPWRGLAACLRARGLDDHAAALETVSDALGSVPADQWP
jgi:tetratricopeptide (TPR) repeat protein